MSPRQIAAILHQDYTDHLPRGRHFIRGQWRLRWGRYGPDVRGWALALQCAC